MATPERLANDWIKGLNNFVRLSVAVLKKILFLEIEGDQKQARDLIEPGIQMKGIRLWFLLASCLIASIGLNTNSSAVIIGAMLISPLMGPMLGLGFGMAIASRRMVRTSVQHMLFSIFVTLILATLYFIISPFQSPTSEILIRTAPNLLDLLVAIAAAFAGVVAMNTSSLAGAVPGVAIATAIMPPLCACAYGIAHANFKIAFGAFYLFFVNAVAITVVAFLLFKRMHFSDDFQEDTENGKIKPAAITLAIILVVAPLIWSLWDAWRDNFIQRSVSRLVESYKPKLEIVSWQWEGTKSNKLVLYNFRKITPDLKNELEGELKKISSNASLELHESAVSPDMEEMANQIKNSQLTTLIKNPKIIEGLVRLATTEGHSSELREQLRTTETEFAALLGLPTEVKAYLRAEENSTDVLVLITAKNATERSKIKRDLPHYKEWLQTKLHLTSDIRIEVL